MVDQITEMYEFQSTHPSGVRLRVRHRSEYHHLISIHAPQWGATQHSGAASCRIPISIHAPQWGATIPPRVSWSKPAHFNPRTPVGCDKVEARLQRIRPISIHAPQWGATRLVFPPVRRDGFQSTHPSGVRQGSESLSDARVISIHAPQWGATLIPRVRRAENGISIHAPQWGATCEARRILACPYISIHAPQWGATDRSGRVGKNRFISIHAPQWGATVLGTSRFPWVSYFNPRTPVGCDTIPRGDAGTAGVFQSTHPSGVRLSVQTATSVDFLFQSTHPSGVRLSAFLLAASLSRFQSTHPSGVRPGRFFLF